MRLYFNQNNDYNIIKRHKRILSFYAGFDFFPTLTFKTVLALGKSLPLSDEVSVDMSDAFGHLTHCFVSCSIPLCWHMLICSSGTHSTNGIHLAF